MGPAAGGALRRVRQHRRRLRPADRDRPVRAGPDRLGDALDLGRRPQGAHDPVPLQRHLHRPHPRPRPRQRRRSTPTARRCRCTRSPTSSTSSTSSAASRPRSASTRRPARTRSPRSPAGRRPGAAATTSTPSSRASSGSPTGWAATASSAPTRWAPAAWARTRRPRWPIPRGELHDTKGVWIGDASAFPTPSGTNPMITIMALARRTAEAIAEDAGAAAPAESKSSTEVPVGN